LDELKLFDCVNKMQVIHLKVNWPLAPVMDINSDVSQLKTYLSRRIDSGRHMSGCIYTHSAACNLECLNYKL